MKRTLINVEEKLTETKNPLAIIARAFYASIMVVIFVAKMTKWTFTAKEI